MSLKCDPRAGSKELIPLLQALRLPVRERLMKFGDFAFTGNGPAGEVRVGIEYKTIDDLLDCMKSKRLVTHQLPGMLKRYTYAYLLIEGCVRPNKYSGLEKFKQFKSYSGKGMGMFFSTRAPISYPMMQRYLFTLENVCGIRVRFTSDKMDSAGFVSALYGWFQKPWGSHHSHLSLPAREDNHPTNVRFILGTPSVVRRMASCIPGIGWARSSAVARKFKTVSGMLEATIATWSEITTTDRNGRSKRIGLKTAKRIHEALRSKG